MYMPSLREALMAAAGSHMQCQCLDLMLAHFQCRQTCECESDEGVRGNCAVREEVP